MTLEDDNKADDLIEIGEKKDTHGKSQTVPASLPSEDKKAQDYLIVTSTSQDNSQILPNNALSDRNDKIDKNNYLQAIRDEILIKQQLYLQQGLAQMLPPGKQEEFEEKDLKSLHSYLITAEGRKNFKTISKDPEFQKQMSEIESSGYKAVQEKFQSDFKKIDWGTGTDDNIRISELKNSEGIIVVSLKETVVKTEPVDVKLADGSFQKIEGYRKIDFPKKLDSTGPLNLSMALKDTKGDNILKKDALYFTAHYDENGKLTEISSPIPIKFASNDPNAIGYIERNGKIYTLPVTQEKYNSMLIEVAKNKGISANIPPLSKKRETNSLEQEIVNTVVNRPESQNTTDRPKPHGKENPAIPPQPLSEKITPTLKEQARLTRAQSEKNLNTPPQAKPPIKRTQSFTGRNF